MSFYDIYAFNKYGNYNNICRSRPNENIHCDICTKYGLKYPSELYMAHTTVDINRDNLISLICAEMTQYYLPMIFRKYYDELMANSFVNKKTYSENIYYQKLLWLYLNIDYYKYHQSVHCDFATYGDYVC